MTAAGRSWPAVVVAIVISLAVGLVKATPATAHNGVGASFRGAAGRYTVYAYDGYPLPSGGLQYRLVLLDAATGEPVAGVVPIITARRPGGAGAEQSAHVTVMANVVLYDLPNPYPGDWNVSLALSGPLGRGRASFPMHGQAPYIPPAVHEEPAAGVTRWVLPGVIGAAAALAGAGAFLMLRRRRERAGSV